MKRILGVATIALLTGGIVLAPTEDGDAQTHAASVPEAQSDPEVQRAARPDFLNRIRIAPSRRALPEGPSEAEAINIAMARGAELRAKRAEGAPLLPASLEPEAVAVTPTADASAPLPAASLWEVTGTRVNLRAGPGTSHPVVGQASLGERMEPLGDTGNDWIEVRRSGGQKAWIFAKFLKKSGG